MQKVVVGVIENTQQQIFIAKRPQHVHLGGLWEFPGGKVEPGESWLEALKRELDEEIGIQVLCAKPLTEYKYHYDDRSVHLSFWHVSAFSGTAHGKEGQQVLWAEKNALAQYPMPKANKAILQDFHIVDSPCQD